jgi:hypothetical protein
MPSRVRSWRGVWSRSHPSSLARQESRTSEVKIQLDDSSIPLKPGFSADIEIIVQEVPNVLRLPTHVILERERGKYV